LSKTILFIFAGRRANLELQRPFLDRIVREHPGIFVEIWNCTQNAEDNAYVRASGKGTRRIVVRNDYHGIPVGKAWNEIYRHYGQPKYKGCRFIKADDDIVFIQTNNLAHFLDSIDSNPHAVCSAYVINNGASCAADPPLYSQLRQLRTPLLNVHLSPQFAYMSHQYFLDNALDIIERPVQWQPTKEWLSINFIGYDYDMARKFARLLETPSPRVIAGRHFRGRATLGDEGMVNTLPRIIVTGFTVAHLTFGPQERKDPKMFKDLRAHYATWNKEYLAR
jgi:hypothetical protein